MLAQKAGLSKEEIRQITIASPIHDIGKIGIAETVLNKPGKLTDEEYEVMKEHAVLGQMIL